MGPDTCEKGSLTAARASPAALRKLWVVVKRSNGKVYPVSITNSILQSVQMKYGIANLTSSCGVHDHAWQKYEANSPGV